MWHNAFGARGGCNIPYALAWEVPVSAHLATIVADLERLEALPASEVPGLLGELEAVRAALWAKLHNPVITPVAVPEKKESTGPDRLLDAAEVAGRLGVSKRWVYRKAPTLPFTKKLSTGTVRFSERGLQRWQEGRR